MNQLQNIKILDKAIRDNETAKDLLYKRIDALREAEEKIEEKIRIIDDNLKVEFKIGLQSKELILKGIERQFAEWLIGDSDKPFFISPDTKEIMPVAILNEQIPELIDYIKIENVECVAYLSGRIQGYKGRETYIDNVDSHSCNFENNKYSSDIDDIEIKHTAHNRQGFALGAVVAAEYIHDKKGIFTMEDVLFN